MLGGLRFHADIHGDDGIRPVPWAQSRPVELTHVRSQAGWLAAMEPWHADAILLDDSPLSPACNAVFAAGTPRRSVRTAWKALRVA